MEGKTAVSIRRSAFSLKLTAYSFKHTAILLPDQYVLRYDALWQSTYEEKSPMHLTDIANRQPHPEPWSEGDNIPWNEPEFSERMLKEHLSQEHDAASRRFEIIDRHVDWIHTYLLGGQAAQILDMACGPGLYAVRLARLGHTLTGIDFSPASIRYARELASAGNLACTFILGDLREVDFGQGFDLCMFIFGEFNVFSPENAARLLAKARHALTPGGLLLLEPHTFEAVQQIGQAPASWSAHPSALFSSRPHLLLEESFWDPGIATATNRYYVIDAATGDVTRYAASYQAYTHEQYRRLLEEQGFGEVTFYPSLGGEAGSSAGGLMAVTGRKQS